MGESTKIVVEHYPAERLPEDLRRGIESGKMVRVTVESEPGEPRPLHELYGFAEGFYSHHGQDPVAFIRQLREEWDT